MSESNTPSDSKCIIHEWDKSTGWQNVEKPHRWVVSYTGRTKTCYRCWTILKVKGGDESCPEIGAVLAVHPVNPTAVVIPELSNAPAEVQSLGAGQRIAERKTPMTDALICQRFIDHIVARAQNSSMGLGAPEKERAYDFSRYEQSLESIAIMLVSAHFEKYDLVALFHAALEETFEHARDLETDLADASKRAEESERLNIEAAYRLADAMNERDHLRAVVGECLRAMPCGNVVTHTPENIAGRISEMAQELARQTAENEQLETALTAETKAVLEATRAMRLLQDGNTAPRMASR